MDPAGPYFDNTNPEVRLDPTDATFVDVMHTDAENFIHLPRLGMQGRRRRSAFWPE